MSIRSVIAASAALREVEDAIDALQAEKQRAIARIDAINTELTQKRADRDVKVTALKAEADTI